MEVIGREIISVVGDGVIILSSTGSTSTAYSMAVNGKRICWCRLKNPVLSDTFTSTTQEF